MDIELNAVELRILGVLIEKQMSTPDYYPLTLNALTNACNQKNNREPVMKLSSEDVETALKSLRNQHWVWQIMTHGSRTPKYEHNLEEKTGCTPRELSLLCELFLRGPQTPGELNTRTARLIESHGIIGIEQTLKKLMERDQGPLVMMLDRQPGHKENRYAHLFCTPEQTEEIYRPSVPEPSRSSSNAASERISALEARVEELETSLEEMKNQFSAFKSQFE
jgi:hypothetical protein